MIEQSGRPNRLIGPERDVGAGAVGLAGAAGPGRVSGSVPGSRLSSTFRSSAPRPMSGHYGSSGDPKSTSIDPARRRTAGLGRPAAQTLLGSSDPPTIEGFGTSGGAAQRPDSRPDVVMVVLRLPQD
jgi:hypothetical protein